MESVKFGLFFSLPLFRALKEDCGEALGCQRFV